MAVNKLQELRDILRSYGSCLVAYSGGVDSVFLAAVAHEVLGDRSLAVLADSPSLPRRELDEAVTIAAQFSIPLRVVRTEEFDNPQYPGQSQQSLLLLQTRAFYSINAVGAGGEVCGYRLR